MNKKGFTLVEVLAVIALIGVLAVFAIGQVETSSENAKRKLCTTKIKLIKDELTMWVDDNDYCLKNPVPTSCTTIVESCNTESGKLACVVSVEAMAENGIIDYDNDDETGRAVINPFDDTNMATTLKYKILYNETDFTFDIVPLAKNDAGLFTISGTDAINKICDV